MNEVKIEWKKKKSMTIVLCSKGYPGYYEKNIRIENINKINQTKSDFIYHAGTKIFEKKIFSNGGRVLNIVSVGNSFRKIRNKIISNIKKLKWKHGFYRKDIGWKVIKKMRIISGLLKGGRLIFKKSKYTPVKRWCKRKYL